MFRRFFLVFVVVLALVSSADAQSKLLIVSYDPTRTLYQELTEAFNQNRKKLGKEPVVFYQSHGGSGKQARAVREGLKADIVSLALAYDIDALTAKKLLPTDWQNRFPHHSAPFTSTVVFLVRKNNPKNIKNWDDLVKPGVRVITPSPKTSGAGRLNFLAAYAFALKKFNGNKQNANDFIKKFYQNCPVLDAGARTAGTTFMERNLGDVLVTWENEALLAIHKSNKKDQFEVVVPPISLLAEPPVTYVDRIVIQKKNTAAAKDFINFLYTTEAQEIFAQNYFRPRDSQIAKRYQKTFPTLKTLRVQDLFVSWENAHELYFRDGALFDQIYLK